MSTRIAFALSFLLAATAAVSPALAQQFVISTYAGGAPPLPTQIAAVNAAIGALGTTTDAAGNLLYIVGSQCVFRVDSNGTVTRIAGTSRPGYSGDGGPAVRVQVGNTSSQEGITIVVR